MNAAQRSFMNPSGADQVTIWTIESRGRREQHTYVVKGDDMVPIEDYLRDQGQSPAEALLVIRTEIPNSGST